MVGRMKERRMLAERALISIVPPRRKDAALMLTRGLVRHISGMRAGIAASLASDPLRSGAHQRSVVYSRASSRFHLRIRVNRTVGRVEVDWQLESVPSR